MAYVESAVVVYLRAIYYPQGFAFRWCSCRRHGRDRNWPGGGDAGDAAGRCHAGRDGTVGSDRTVLHRLRSVGYRLLRLVVGFPPVAASLLTWDVLFLIPVPGRAGGGAGDRERGDDRWGDGVGGQAGGREAGGRSGGAGRLFACAAGARAGGRRARALLVHAGFSGCGAADGAAAVSVGVVRGGGGVGGGALGLALRKKS